VYLIDPSYVTLFVRFHVVVPSLPGYGFSSLPRRKEFSIEDMARIFDTLMTKVLGYGKYVGQGGDWGSHILRFTAQHHSDTAPLLHFNMFYTVPPEEHVKEQDLSETEVKAVKRREDFLATGSGYSAIQSTKPSTIGYAIGSSPLALLAYIGEKILAWSDPSTLDLDDLLATVAIYWLTDSFHTSVMIYQQNTKQREIISSREGTRGRMKSTIGYSAFPYEIGTSPRSWIAQCANLVQYNVHQKGGHFPALDNPSALIGDVRSLVAAHWWDLQGAKSK